MRKRIALLTNWKFRSAVTFINSVKHVRVKPLRIFRSRSRIIYQRDANFKDVTLTLRAEYFLIFCTMTCHCNGTLFKLYALEIKQCIFFQIYHISHKFIKKYDIQ